MKVKPSLTLFVLSSLMILIYWGCVDVPSSGEPAPDYRSQIRYLHAGRGVDTIAFFVRSDTVRTTIVDSSTSIVGPDTIKIRTTRSVVTSDDKYKRALVDFSASFDFLVDASLLTNMSFGQATAYVNTLSGSRAFKLRASVPLTDTIYITKTDSAVTIVWDTVGRGSSSFDTSIFMVQYSIVPTTGTVTEIVDSGVVSVGTERKSTVFLIGDTTAAVKKDDNLIRYGRIKYLVGLERSTYEPAGIADTALVRVANASATAGIIDTARAGSVDLARTLLFGTIRGYAKLQASTPTQYTLDFRKGGINVLMDSITVSSTKRYTVVLLDSASSIILKKLTDD